MLKKVVLLLLPMVLMSCQENTKDNIQELLVKKEYVQAKQQAETMLEQHPLDQYYNGVLGYISAVECLSTNCAVNKPELLENTKQYLENSQGIVNVSQAYFVDFYSKSIKNIIKLALQQPSVEQATLVLDPFINVKNNRVGFIYDELYKSVISSILEGENKKAMIGLGLLKSLEFGLSLDQIVSIELLMALESDKPLSVLKERIKAFNRVFIGKDVPKEFLVAFAPVLVDFSLNNGLNPVKVLEKTIQAKPSVLGENGSILKQPNNKLDYAKGVELVANSEAMKKRFSLSYDEPENLFNVKLKNLSLSIYPLNADLWASYVKDIIDNGDISYLYHNIDLDSLSADIVIANNNALMAYAEETLSTESIIDILNETIFREDSKKDYYTQQVFDLVKKALKVEMSKNNLDGIFNYLNYIPAMKSHFGEDLNQKLNMYIYEAWEKNQFEKLDKLVDLYQDLNSKPKKDLILDLYEEFMLSQDSEKFFVANTIENLVRYGSEDEVINENVNSKYRYVRNKVSKTELENRIFSVVRKLHGIYTQVKVFSFYDNTFSDAKRDDLVIDAATVALAKDQNLSLSSIMKLANFLLEKCNRLPENYIKEQIVARYSSAEDVILSWSEASKATKRALQSYNKDIASLIKAKEYDSKNNKIVASKYISKIKSDEISQFIKKYKDIYNSYVEQVKGYYVKQTGDKGPEVIYIEPTKTLLKVDVRFVSRLGQIENLDKYKLDRGEILTKQFNNYYNPIKGEFKLNDDFSSKDKKVFAKAKSLKINGSQLTFAGNKYKKVKSLFVFNKRFGILEQVTGKTRDNFHILPEGSSIRVVAQVSDDVYQVEVKHPGVQKSDKPILVNAKYDEQTLSFMFEYDYFIKSFEKNFSAKAKCQMVSAKIYCAVQDKYWKRENYSIIVKGLQVK
jgi:hypothetical protein